MELLIKKEEKHVVRASDQDLRKEF